MADFKTAADALKKCGESCNKAGTHFKNAADALKACCEKYKSCDDQKLSGLKADVTVIDDMIDIKPSDVRPITIPKLALDWRSGILYRTDLDRLNCFPLNPTYGIMSDKDIMSVKKPVPIPKEEPLIKKIDRYIEQDISMTRHMCDFYNSSLWNSIRKEKEKMYNKTIVKIGDKFYKPTGIEVKAADPWSYTEYKVHVSVDPFHQVDVPKPVDPFAIKEVRFNGPATIVFWKDGTKTVVKANHGDTFDPEKGLAMAFAKKALGNKYEYYGKFQKLVKKGMKK